MRENRQKELGSTLAAGQAVLVGGPVTNGARDARLVLIRKAATTPSS